VFELLAPKVWYEPLKITFPTETDGGFDAFFLVLPVSWPCPSASCLVVNNDYLRRFNRADEILMVRDERCTYRVDHVTPCSCFS
jgi:hypothetical protein